MGALQIDILVSDSRLSFNNLIEYSINNISKMKRMSHDENRALSKISRKSNEIQKAKDLWEAEKTLMELE